MDITLRYTVPAAIIAAALILRPIPAEPVTISVELAPFDPPIVNITHEPAAVTVEMQPAVINVPSSVKSEPVTVVVEPAPVLPPEIVYQDRVRDRIVEVPACLDYTALPYFDLANALSVAFPGAQWSLSGSYWNGLVWLDDSPQPSFEQVLGGWLTHLEQDC